MGLLITIDTIKSYFGETQSVVVYMYRHTYMYIENPSSSEE